MLPEQVPRDTAGIYLGLNRCRVIFAPIAGWLAYLETGTIAVNVEERLDAIPIIDTPAAERIACFPCTSYPKRST